MILICLPRDFLGIIWGWARSTDVAAKPYICEINRSDVYKIMGEERTFGM